MRLIMSYTANKIFNLQVSCAQYIFPYININLEVLIAKAEDISFFGAEVPGLV